MCQKCQQQSPVEQELLKEIAKEDLCEWCTIAPADVEYTFKEPIQLNLLHKTILAMRVCAHCLETVTYAEEYALYA